MIQNARLLLVNINNTFAKAALARGGSIGKVVRIPTAELTEEKAAALVYEKRPGRVVVCSVVPSKNELFHSSHRCGVLQVSRHLNLGNLTLNYPGKKTLGADRIADLVAAAHLHAGDRVVIDAGTAVAINFLTKQNEFLGGMIAPGLRAFSDYLPSRTAQLPNISLRRPRRAIGRNTRDSIRAGTLLGFEGMIRHLLDAGIREAGFRRPKIVATGGDAKLIASRLPLIHCVDELLTLRGLLLLSCLNP